jgi:hypothetical protein
VRELVPGFDDVPETEETLQGGTRASLDNVAYRVTLW